MLRRTSGRESSGHTARLQRWRRDASGRSAAVAVVVAVVAVVAAASFQPPNVFVTVGGQNKNALRDNVPPPPPHQASHSKIKPNLKARSLYAFASVLHFFLFVWSLIGAGTIHRRVPPGRNDNDSLSFSF